MKVDKETLRKIAHLARLDFEENAEKDMINSMTEILTWVEKGRKGLNAVNVELI